MVGDPIAITREQAAFECGLRWPGVDPDSLEVEFDLDFEKAAAEAERQRLEALAGVERHPQEFDLGVDQLLAQADLLQQAALQVSLEPTTQEGLEKAAAEVQMIRDLARGLAAPAVPGRLIEPAPAEPEAGSTEAPRLEQRARPTGGDSGEPGGE